MKDVALVLFLVVAFAFAATMHVAVVYGLAKVKPRWPSVVALVFPPIAPYWAWQRHMKARAFSWIAAVVLYAFALVLATRGP